MYGEGLTTFFQMILLAYTGNHSDFDKIDCKDASYIQSLRTGDLILRTAENKPGSLFYHAGVYCGNKEVIDFSLQTEEAHSLVFWSSSSKGKGTVTKTGTRPFIKNKPFYILRLRSGIPENFPDNVKTAMNSEEDYNLLTNNCLHFSLRLLGVHWENHNIDFSMITNWLDNPDFYDKVKRKWDFFALEWKQLGLEPTLMGEIQNYHSSTQKNLVVQCSHPRMF